LHSQIGFKVTHIRPTGELGYFLKPAFSGELIFKPVKSTNHFVTSFGLGFIQFSPRLDTFPSAGYIIYKGSVNSYSVVPGKLAPGKVQFVYFSFGGDYLIKVNDSINFYPGVEVTLGHSSSKHYEYFPGISSGSYRDNYLFLSGGLRVGFEYTFRSKTAFFVEAKRKYNKLFKGNSNNYNEYSIGVRFRLKK
jgi:hypothetical protein